jgi:hypothetical protein
MLLRVCPGSRILSFHPTLEEAQYRVLLPFLLRLVSLNEEVAVMESRRLAERVGGVGRGTAGRKPATVGVYQFAWRKTSRSTSNGNCVEVAQLQDGHVGVRDTKDLWPGPFLAYAGVARFSFFDGADMTLRPGISYWSARSVLRAVG